METDFVAWLQAEMDKKGWDQSDLARAAGIQPGTVSRIMMGTRGFGPDFLQKIAPALGVPLETIYRRAGWLPEYGEIMAEAREWSKRLTALSAETRVRAVRAMEEILVVYENVEGPRRR